MKKLIVLLLSLCPMMVLADRELSLTCDKVDKINVNDEIICRVSINSSFLYDKIDFEVKNAEGLSVVDVRSNYEKRWQITKNNNLITVKSESVQSELQEFGIILVKALKDGIQDIALDNIKLENTSTEEVKELESITQSLKIISSDNLLKTIKIDGKELENFDSQTTYYTLNINDETSINIEAESNNDYAKVKGTGDFKLSDKTSNFIFPITVLSEDNTSKIYVLNVKRVTQEGEKINKDLESLIIKNDKGNTLLINFNPKTYEYYFDVDINTKYLDIKPTLDNKNVKFVKGYGEQRLNVESGNNLVIIKIQDNDGDVLNYVLNITKPIANKSSNNYIKSLLIKNYKINFNKRIKNYSLAINSSDNKLEITPILENSNARYIITGNNDLKEGSVIKIEVTAENEEKTVYKINIKEKKTNYFKYILWLVVGGIVLFIVNSLKNKIKTIINSTRKIISNIDISKITTNSNKNNSTKGKKKNTKKKTPKKNSKTSNKKPVSKKGKKTTSNKKVTNSTSTRSPRSNYTKKSPTKKKKTGKKNTTNKKKSTKKK